MNHFQDMVKAFEKSQKVVEKEGTPRFYIRELYEIEKEWLQILLAFNVQYSFIVNASV